MWRRDPRSFIEAEAFTEAQTEFETCLKRGGETTSIFLNDRPSFRYFPEVHYYLGKAYEGLCGGGAKASYEAFLKIKGKAQPGDPLIADARKRIG